MFKLPFLNILSNLSSVGPYVLLDKLVSRVFEFFQPFFQFKNVQLFKSSLISVDDLLCSIDRALYLDSKKLLSDNPPLVNDFTKQSYLGGSSSVLLLYFFTRLLQPKYVVETGVAAGFSSYSILLGLSHNQMGNLFSSDLPYFRQSEPLRFIGSAVPEFLADRWNLSLDGDLSFSRRLPHNLPLSSVKLLHYDSDKSFRGRSRFYRSIFPYLSSDAVLIFDDIEDNSHFACLSRHFKNSVVKTIFFNNKFIGIILPASLYS